MSAGDPLTLYARVAARWSSESISAISAYRNGVHEQFAVRDKATKDYMADPQAPPSDKKSG